MFESGRLLVRTIDHECKHDLPGSGSTTLVLPSCPVHLFGKASRRLAALYDRDECTIQAYYRQDAHTNYTPDHASHVPACTLEQLVEHAKGRASPRAARASPTDTRAGPPSNPQERVQTPAKHAKGARARAQRGRVQRILAQAHPATRRNAFRPPLNTQRAREPARSAGESNGTSLEPALNPRERVRNARLACGAISNAASRLDQFGGRRPAARRRPSQELKARDARSRPAEVSEGGAAVGLPGHAYSEAPAPSSDRPPSRCSGFSAASRSRGCLAPPQNRSLFPHRS